MTTQTLLVLLLTLLLAGCAAQPPAAAPADPEAQDCLAWLARVDEQVGLHGVRDAQSHRLAGFPHLRIERFEAALRGRAAQDEASFLAWLEHLAALGAQAQEIELRKLPDAGIASLGLSRDDALARAAACRGVLRAAEAVPGSRRDALIAQARVPGAYATAARVAGLYALTRWPFHLGVKGWQQQTQAKFNAVAEGVPPDWPLRRYRLAIEPGPDAAPALARAPRDALGVPQPDAALLQQLIQQHAPVLEIEHAGSFDSPGRALPHGDGGWVLDHAQPTLYTRVAYTLVQGRPALQLVYLVWFAERPPRSPFDLLAGRWNGVVWRVTLGADGRPLLYDSIHACGCYHLFFPTAAVQARPAPVTGIEWVFAPAAAPALQAGQRMVLRLASASHYVVGVRAETPQEGIGYSLRAEDELRGLPPAAGAVRQPWRGLYGPDGLIAGSERAERWFFWPMGVPSAGAQRQWGHHATAFVGRRHFDDADLIDLRFEPRP